MMIIHTRQDRKKVELQTPPQTPIPKKQQLNGCIIIKVPLKVIKYVPIKYGKTEDHATWPCDI